MPRLKLSGKYPGTIYFAHGGQKTFVLRDFFCNYKLTKQEQGSRIRRSWEKARKMMKLR